MFLQQIRMLKPIFKDTWPAMFKVSAEENDKDQNKASPYMGFYFS